jgi:hypothetical protein
MKEKTDAKNRISIDKDNASQKKAGSQTYANYSIAEKGAASVSSFTSFSSSFNIYGVLSSYSKPLHYNDNINAVSFIQRISACFGRLFYFLEWNIRIWNKQCLILIKGSGT